MLRIGYSPMAGTHPLTDYDEVSIQNGLLTTPQIERIARGDPAGCCKLLKQESLVKKPTHLELIDAVIAVIGEDSYLYQDATALKVAITEAVAVYEASSEKEKADREAAAREIQETLRYERLERALESERRAKDVLGETDEQASRPDTTALASQESGLERQKAQVSLHLLLRF